VGGKGAEAEASTRFGAARGGCSPGLRQSPPEPPPSPGTGLTALVGVAVFGCALVQGLLLSVMVFISFPVSAGTGTDPSLERPPAEDLATGSRGRRVTLLLPGKRRRLRPAQSQNHSMVGVGRDLCGSSSPSSGTSPAKRLPTPPAREAAEPPRRGCGEPLGSSLPRKRSSCSRGRLQLLAERLMLGWVPSPSKPAEKSFSPAAG